MTLSTVDRLRGREAASAATPPAAPNTDQPSQWWAFAPSTVHVGEPPTERWGQWMAGVVLIDFLIGFGLLWDRFPLPGVGQPAGVPLMALAIAVGIVRRPTRRIQQFWLIIGVYLFMLAWAIVVSHLKGLDWHQRATKMVILLVFAMVLSAGRIHVRSLLLGLSVSMVVNVPLFYAGLTSNSYPPFLTGFFGDKNVAGLMYALMAVLGLAMYSTWRGRVLHVLVFGTFLALTGSRTSMAGLTAALLWIAARAFLPLMLRLAAGGGLAALLAVIERQFARIWVFKDREGTDWFREQVDVATRAKLHLSPWFGDGLTTAWVQMGNRFMFFHDSYAALRIEGGWVMVAVMLSLFVLVAGGLLTIRGDNPVELITEAGIVVVLVCAWKLGEVFFTTPAFLALGLALLAHRTRPFTDRDLWSTPTTRTQVPSLLPRLPARRP